MKTYPLYQPRVKTPTILQMEATECGAVALSIIMGYYGKFVSSEDVRIACGVSRDGTKAINIIKSARNYGLQAHGLNVSIDQLDMIKVPFIVYWNFNHFLVVEGFTSKKVYLNDPDTGPRSVGWEEFEQNFTAVVLELRPGENFQPTGKPEKSIVSLLLQMLGKNYAAMLFIILTTLALIIPQLAAPIFTKAFVDNVLIEHQKSLILAILSGLAFTTFSQTVLTWLQSKFLNRLKIKLSMINAVNFLWHMLHLPIRYFQQRAAGDIAQRDIISDNIAKILAHDLPMNVVSIIEMIAFATLLFILSWKISLILMFLLSFNLIFTQLTRRYLTDIGRRYAQDKGKLDGIETNGLHIIETLKVSALEHHFFSRWIAYYTKLSNTEQKIIWTTSLLNMLPRLLSQWINIVIICYGAYLVMMGSITIGTILAIQGLLSNFMGPMESVFAFISQMNQFKGDTVRLDDVINTQLDPHFTVDPKQSRLLLKPSQHPVLKMMNATFHYSPLDPPVFENISLELRCGERIAIVGPSGCGKSSMARLICSLDKLSSGNILLNGISYTQLSREAISQYIAFVDQNMLFFPGSLRDNLTYWDETVPDEKIFEVLKQVYLYDEVVNRGGLDIPIQEGGSNFSGGQCQRLEIARALLRNPTLLILDEATSAMDATLEANIYSNLLSMGYTMFIIAHRLSAIRECDRIYVLKDGQFVQQGCHKELITQPGLYRELVMMETL